MTLQIGDPLPNLIIPATGSTTLRLHNLIGKNIVFYFYPKDDTPGCTLEAKDFRDHHAEFLKYNTVILGVSRDTLESHTGFQCKYQLPFTLLSDNNSELCGALGVIKPKSLFGKTFLGIDRSTFLFNTQGKLVKLWRRVKVKDHVTTVLATVKALSTEKVIPV